MCVCVWVGVGVLCVRLCALHCRCTFLWKVRTPLLHRIVSTWEEIKANVKCKLQTVFFSSLQVLLIFGSTSWYRFDVLLLGCWNKIQRESKTKVSNSYLLIRLHSFYSHIPKHSLFLRYLRPQQTHFNLWNNFIFDCIYEINRKKTLKQHFVEMGICWIAEFRWRANSSWCDHEAIRWLKIDPS